MKEISFEKMAKDILQTEDIGPMDSWSDQEAVEEKVVVKLFPHLAEKYKTASVDAKMAYLDSVKSLYIQSIANGGQNAINS